MSDAEAPPTLAGGGLVLRRVRPADAAARKAHGWHRDIERHYGHDRGTGPMSEDEATSWVQAVLGEASPTFWAIDVDEPATTLAGHVFLHRVNRADRSAVLAIGMFSPELTGRGLGTTATRLVLRHAFDTLDLHRVGLRVLSTNGPAIACYLRCGFVQEGRERESCRTQGQWQDDLVMGVLADEFRAADAGLPHLT